MKKYFLLILLGIISFVSTAMAQTSLVATLSHEGEVSNYYGADALVNAYEKAAAGDIITLSSGVFNPVETIGKALTIRGAGMGDIATPDVEPTIVAKDVEIKVVEDNIKQEAATQEKRNHLVIEGIKFTSDVKLAQLHNGLFLKCKFRKVTYEGEEAICDDNTFLQCRVEYLWATSSKGTFTFENCIVVGGSANASVVCKNTILIDGMSADDYSDYRNCVFINTSSSSFRSTYYNNLWISDGNLDRSLGVSNVKVDTKNEAISNLIGDYSDDKDYKLSEDAKKLITGSDGTEVGIYGGELPFDPTPSNPQITKFNVAKQTTADGKLSVEIEVK